jgi:hypothetical protein
VNRFIGIIASGEQKQERLASEWKYLYKLLRSEPVEVERIDAYLNILQQQDSSQKKALIRTRNSQTSHPDASKYLGIVNSLSQLLLDNDERFAAFKKQEQLL